MPKVSDINLGTDIVNPVRPDVDDGMEPIQCINGHWTTTGDLDEAKCCSQCPIEDRLDGDPILNEDEKEELERLTEDEDFDGFSFYDDGKD
jgi:hypothetical protein